MACTEGEGHHYCEQSCLTLYYYPNHSLSFIGREWPLYPIRPHLPPADPLRTWTPREGPSPLFPISTIEWFLLVLQINSSPQYQWKFGPFVQSGFGPLGGVWAEPAAVHMVAKSEIYVQLRLRDSIVDEGYSPKGPAQRKIREQWKSTVRRSLLQHKTHSGTALVKDKVRE